MKTIAFVVAHFGQMRNDFDLWLHSCTLNPTVDWILFTDCGEGFEYPSNVKRYETSFETFKERLQELFDFPIALDNPRKLCDFKVAYGELLENEELKDYDFWGYCDLDIIWGDIRQFLTEDILRHYHKIGFTGNCTLLHNDLENNRLYRQKNRCGTRLYKKYFSSPSHFCFDEVGFNDIYLQTGKPFYRKVVFSNLASHRPNFAACFLPKNEQRLNHHVIYSWENGHLFHIAVASSGLIRKEFMFVHFLASRTFAIHFDGRPARFLIVPNKMLPYYPLTVPFVKAQTHTHWMTYIGQQMQTQQSILGKLSILKKIAQYNYWLRFHGHVFNYWIWTHYEGDQAGRMNLFT